MAIHAANRISDSLSDVQLERLGVLLEPFGLTANQWAGCCESGFDFGQDLLAAGEVRGRGQLSLGLNSPRCECQRGKVFWIPADVDHDQLQRSVFVASTRLGQNLESKRNWFDALRTLAFRMQLDQRTLITAPRTTAHPFVQRLAQLLDVSLITLKIMPAHFDSQWINSQSNSQNCIYVLDLDSCEPASRRNRDQVPADMVLASVANQVYAISARSGGNVTTAMENRIATSDRPTFVLADRSLMKKKTFMNLIDKGALPWFLYKDDCQTEKKEQRESLSITNQAVPTVFPNELRILSLDEVACEHFLLHWTRRRVGAWPDQSQDSYLDDLIFQTNRANHEPLHALSRILASRRLVGSSDISREGQPVVCFSEVPLSEVVNRKTFRSHLARWDFEPFGVAILRESLHSSGIRPVIYGDESIWAELSAEERPYFQLAQTQSGKIDWTEEKEWRLRGDLDLRKFDANQLLVFVPTREAAESIAALCHWPIVVLNSNS